MLGHILIFSLNLFYGKKPRYEKFKTLEYIARSPYQSWELISYFLTTLFSNNQNKIISYSKSANFGKRAQDNETEHLIIISQICKEDKIGNVILHSFIPIVVSYFHFMISFVLFLINKRFSYELNYIFENHAYEQYNQFLEENPDLKKQKINSKYLNYLDKNFKSGYDLIKSIRDDELIHRNNSIRQMFN